MGPVNRLRVKLHGVNHTSPDDIDILLVGPSGAKVLLQTDAGGVTPVSDATYTFASLDVFNTSDPNGNWSLYVFDDIGGHSGTVAAWSLEITTDTTAATTYNKCAFRKGRPRLGSRTPSGRSWR